MPRIKPYHFSSYLSLRASLFWSSIFQTEKMSFTYTFSQYQTWYPRLSSPGYRESGHSLSPQEPESYSQTLQAWGERPWPGPISMPSMKQWRRLPAKRPTRMCMGEEFVVAAGRDQGGGGQGVSWHASTCKTTRRHREVYICANSPHFRVNQNCTAWWPRNFPGFIYKSGDVWEFPSPQV